MKKSFITVLFMAALFVVGGTGVYAYEKIQVDSVDGTIWDYKDNRILFLDANHGLKVKDQSTGQITTIAQGKTPTVGFLTPKGAIFLAKSDGAASTALYDWRDGNLIELGTVDPTLIVKGNYAVYNIGSTIYLRDLTTGESKLVTDKADDHGYDVSDDWRANGASTVVWSNKEDHQIYSYLEGRTKKITNNSQKQHFSPITDGVNIMYTRIPVSGYGDAETVVYYNDGWGWITENIIATSSTLSIPYQDYTVNSGYVASYLNSNKDSLTAYQNSGTPNNDYILNYNEPIKSFKLGMHGDVLFATMSDEVYYWRDVYWGSDLTLTSISANAKVFWLERFIFVAEGGVLSKVLVSSYDNPPVNTVTPAPGSGWTNITEYTVTAVDDGSNVKTVWHLNGNIGEGTTVKIPSEGRHVLTVSSDDSGGNNDYDYIEIKVDTTPPVTTSTFTPDGDRFSVTLSAKDNLSGVKGIFYRINQGNWTQYYFPLKLTASEKDSLEFYSVDNAGNKEAEVPPPPSDTTAPTTELLANAAAPAAWYNADVSVKLNASDGASGSGIAKTFYRTNEGEWKEYSAPFTLSAAAAYKIEYYSSDLAGNKETAKSVTLGIDKTAPVTTYKVTPVYGTDKPAPYIKGYTVTLTAADSLSGVKATFYRTKGGAWTKYTAPFNLQSGEGNTNLEFYSEDHAGNKEVHS
ncbi:hypothetical protein KZ483_25770 [Paenibacillus sp. sptzw28]|uniref:OmpL47-type beta-barrel domain-containing protein n=1 Tax=Paenibacillus sp. sptzw28 TaxID=715179 RepID=UPI001C6E469E|nr:hypothetical protein [Paenibacillus sp. sptzw28]QYR21086.1 hypothetical protein KZ483_25770 [Paenibacillus sp. sptzw28]